MKCNEVRDLLDDLVDGELAPEERAVALSHIEGCGDCRSELEGLTGLLQQTESLARSVEPPRDLWLEIAGNIDKEKVVRGRFDLPIVRLAAVAAAAAVLVVAVVVGYTVGRQQSELIATVQPTKTEIVEAVFAPGSLASVEVEFHRARSDLLAILDQRRPDLSPETMRVVDSNLQLIDDAIEQISEALGRDPDNPQLSHRLASAYRQQIQLLRRATNLPSEI
jgi:hypothetical protein